MTAFFTDPRNPPARPRNGIAAPFAILALAMSAVLAGCESAPVQEDKPAAGAEGKPPAATAKPQPQTRPTDTKPITGVDLATAKGPTPASALKDPANILSQRSIYYAFDKYDIQDDYKPIVDAHAKYLREHPEAKMLIQGNTDERGSREYNIALGQRRSEGVRRLLILLGAKEDQIEAVSLGEEKPKAQGTSEEAYAENRRSDILYKGEY